MKIYVVSGRYRYQDQSKKWLIASYIDDVAAMKHCQEAEKWLEANADEISNMNYSQLKKVINPHDYFFDAGYLDQTEYDYDEIELFDGSYEPNLGDYYKHIVWL